MSDPVSLVFEDDNADDVAGVHAIVIGVGYYKHFPGGDGIEFAGHGNMGQLSSPPMSARHVADWIIETYKDDSDRPLRSLHLLLSEAEEHASYKPEAQPAKIIKQANFTNVKDAIRQWKSRGDASEDNLLIFYFCGHGISSGTQHTILCNDFGESTEDEFEHAINFNDFHRGMDRCKALSQCYFVDACRVGSPSLMESSSSKGQSIIRGVISFGEKTRAAPIFRSSMPGTEAFGLADAPSAFAQALPLAFKGGAWRQEAGEWVVCASLLKLALETHLRRILREFGGIEKRVVSDHDVTLTLKSPTGIPLVPVEVGCSPKKANVSATLSYSAQNGSKIQRANNDESEWQLELEKGSYKFEAKFPTGGDYQNNALEDEIVFPPLVDARIKVL